MQRMMHRLTLKGINGLMFVVLLSDFHKKIRKEYFYLLQLLGKIAMDSIWMMVGSIATEVV